MSIKNRKILLITLIIASIIPYVLAANSLVPRFGFIDSDVLKIYANNLASFLGLLGASIIWWQFVLGIRPLSSKWLIDLVWINKIHKNFGIYGTLLIFAHPLLLLYSYGFDQLYGFIVPEGEFQVQVTLGKFALAILLFIWLTSAILREKITFRRWKFLHFLTYPLFPIVFLHAKDLGAFLGESEALRIYFAFLMITYVLFVVIRIFFQLGYGKKLYILRQINELTPDTNEYIFAVKKGKGIIPQNGQLVYLQIEAFGENHPFTVSKYNKDKDLLAITSKKLGLFTEKMRNLAIGSEVLIDGAYGVFTAEAYTTEKKVVLISGGIGITPFVRLIQSASNLKQIPFLFNCNKAPNDLVYADLIKENLNNDFVNIYSNLKPEEITEARTESGFFKVDYIKKYIGEDLNLNDYFVCGPPIMMKMVIKDLKGAGVKPNQIFSERFSI